MCLHIAKLSMQRLNIRNLKLMFCDSVIQSGVFFFRSSRLDVFCKKVVRKSFMELTGKHMCPSLLFFWGGGGREGVGCFPMNFAKFLGTPFFKVHLWWLLLSFLFFF